MRSVRILVLALVGAFADANAQSAAAPVLTTVRVAVDSVHHRIVVTAGPFDLKPSPTGMMGMDGAMHHDMAESNLMRFEWPVNGDLTGADVVLRDAHGTPVPHGVFHHFHLYNFSRRQLAYPAVEFLFGWGEDTRPVQLPSGVGLPVPTGERLGFLIAWHTEQGHDIPGAELTFTLNYASPKADRIKVLPFWVDVNNQIGGSNAFDVPPGRSARTYDFTLPVSGRLIAAGGHMHDYGVSMQLVDVASKKVLLKLGTKRTATGEVLATERFIFGFDEYALPLEANRTYRIVAQYDNPTGKLLPAAGMGHINGVFEPDDLAAWPKLDLSDSTVQRSIAALPPEQGAEKGEHEHQHDMDGTEPHAAMPSSAPATTDSVAKPPRR